MLVALRLNIKAAAFSDPGKLSWGTSRSHNLTGANWRKMDRILDGREHTCRGTMVGAGRVKASLKKGLSGSRKGDDKIKMRLKGGGGRANPVDLVGPFGSSQNKGTFEGVLTSGRKW